MALNKPISLEEVKKVRGGRIVKVGLELEGAWKPEQIQPNMRLAGDASVQFPELGGVLMHRGELNSHPMAQSEVEPWIRQFYPYYVNKTCGLHVHMSTKYAFYYQMLMDIKYPSTILKYMRKWAENNKLEKDHPIWDRLDGKSEYCQHLFYADDQVLAGRKDHDRHAKGHRYTVANYCYKRYNTVEIRLLPMMGKAGSIGDVDLAVSAVKEVVSITERFLVATAAKEPKLRESIPLISRSSEEYSQVEVFAGPERGNINLHV